MVEDEGLGPEGKLRTAWIVQRQQSEGEGGGGGGDWRGGCGGIDSPRHRRSQVGIDVGIHQGQHLAKTRRYVRRIAG